MIIFGIARGAISSHWMYRKFSTALYSCVPTLPCKLQHAKHVKCNAFSSVDCGWLWKEPVFVVGWHWKEPVVYSRCSKWCPFAFMCIACTQSCCPVIDGLVDDALQNASPRINDSLLQVADVSNRGSLKISRRNIAPTYLHEPLEPASYISQWRLEWRHMRDKQVYKMQTLYPISKAILPRLTIHRCLKGTFLWATRYISMILMYRLHAVWHDERTVTVEMVEKCISKLKSSCWYWSYRIWAP